MNTPIAEELPPHVIISIVQFCLADPVPKLDVLSLCSDLYIAAIPILYHFPKIASKLDSFFLHARPSPSSPSLNLSDRELVKAGHTKLAALRHVHHLQVTFPTLNVIAPSKQQVEAARQLAKAEKELRSLPKGPVMPKLSAVQILGAEPYGDLKLGPIYQRSNFNELLLERSTPTLCCQNPARVESIPFTLFDMAAEDPTFITPTLHLHTRALDYEFYILVGGTTVVYLLDTPGTVPPDFKILASWLGGQISESFNIALDGAPENRRRELMGRTRIRFFGRSPESESQMGLAGGSGLKASFRRQFAEGMFCKAVEFAYVDGIDDPPQQYVPLQLEVSLGESASGCPVCGMEA